MKKTFYSALVLSLICLASGLKALPIKHLSEKGTETEIRQLPAFTAITNTGSVDIILRQGSKQEVKVVADQGMAQRVVTEVDGNTLIVKNPGSFRNIRVMRVLITIPDIREIKLSGSGDLKSEGEIACNDFVFNIFGSGDLDLTLKALNLKGTVTGSGDAEIDGISGVLDLTLRGSGDVVCRNLDLKLLKLEVNGSGDVKMEGSATKIVVGHYSSGDILLAGLKTAEADVEQRGSGDCSLYVSSVLNVSNAGSGDVYVEGNPERRRGHSSGSGEIHYR